MKYKTLEGMFKRYHDIRAELSSARTSMPDAEALSMDIQVLSTQKSRESLEYKKAFIADIQIFIKSLEWCDRYVLMGRNRPAGEKICSYNKIKRLIKARKHGRDIAYHYRDKSHMSKRYWDYLYPHASDYFKEIGYLK
jgi:hypothetical protein